MHILLSLALATAIFLAAMAFSRGDLEYAASFLALAAFLLPAAITTAVKQALKEHDEAKA